MTAVFCFCLVSPVVSPTLFLIWSPLCLVFLVVISLRLSLWLCWNQPIFVFSNFIPPHGQAQFFPWSVLNSIFLHSVFPAQCLWFLILERFSHCFNHSHDLVFTKYCSFYYLSFLNSLSLITTCSVSAYLSFSLLYPVTHSFWDLQSINLFDSLIFTAASFLHWPQFFWLTGLYFYLSASLYMVSLAASHIALSPFLPSDIFSCNFLISIPAFLNVWRVCQHNTASDSALPYLL